jgi:soluble lytic murein transglycosylase-like protein
MAKYSVLKVEATIKSSFKTKSYNYSTPSVKAANIKMIKDINAKYGTIIKYWGNVFEIASGVIIGFIATESGGVMSKPNKYKATGLMQATPSAVFECVYKWKNEVSSPLPDEVRQLAITKVPELLTAKTLTSSLESKLLTLLQSDANFNVMSGTLILRWNIERFSTFFTGGQLNKAMVAYNAGAYTKALVVAGTSTVANKIPVDSTVLANNLKVPTESRAYLYKMLGVDGFINLVYKDKAI